MAEPTAAAIIRGHIEALPEPARKPWIYHDDSAVIPEPQTVRVLMLGADGGSLLEVGQDVSEAEARYIALLGPQVGAKLADLLDALHWFPQVGDRATDSEYAADILAARDALEDAITRTKETTS